MSGGEGGRPGGRWSLWIVGTWMRGDRFSIKTLWSSTPCCEAARLLSANSSSITYVDEGKPDLVRRAGVNLHASKSGRVDGWSHPNYADRRIRSTILPI